MDLENCHVIQENNKQPKYLLAHFTGCTSACAWLWEDKMGSVEHVCKSAKDLEMYEQIYGHFPKYKLWQGKQSTWQSKGILVKGLFWFTKIMTWKGWDDILDSKPHQEKFKSKYLARYQATRPIGWKNLV